MRRPLWIASSAAVILISAVVALRLRARPVDREAVRELLPDPDDAAKKVEVYWEKPAGVGPWPMVVYLHGHQEPLKPGGKTSSAGESSEKQLGRDTSGSRFHSRAMAGPMVQRISAGRIPSVPSPR